MNPLPAIRRQWLERGGTCTRAELDALNKARLEQDRKQKAKRDMDAERWIAAIRKQRKKDKG